MPLQADTVLRLAVLFAHLMLCVFALQTVLSCDWKLLTRTLAAQQLERAHLLLTLLLGGLWVTGVALVGIDTRFDPDAIAARPKLIAKLASVCTLSLNAAVLRAWCFPRIADSRQLGRLEAMAVMGFGAVSTSSWLMAAFFGIAKPLQALTAGQCLALYVAVVSGAVVVSLVLARRLRHGQPLLATPAAHRMRTAGP